MNRTARRTPLLALAVVTGSLALPLAMVAPAQAGDDDVIRRGGCSGSTHWKLKAGEDDGRVEVEAEVDSNRTGQTWSWRLLHNGDVSARGRATTRGASGSFEVRRLVVDMAGDDTLVFRARHAGSGETCRGTVTY